MLPSPVKFLPRRKKKGKLTWIRRVAGCRLGLKPDPDQTVLYARNRQASGVAVIRQT